MKEWQGEQGTKKTERRIKNSEQWYQEKKKKAEHDSQ